MYDYNPYNNYNHFTNTNGFFILNQSMMNIVTTTVTSIQIIHII
jgi:hypothetical protein